MIQDSSKNNDLIGKSAYAFRTISEASVELGLPQHVLRFWESKFHQIKPLKRGGNRRYYRPEDLEVLKKIRSLLYDEGYTIKGVQKLFKESSFRNQSNLGIKRPVKLKEMNNSAFGQNVINEILAELEELKRILDQK